MAPSDKQGLPGPSRPPFIPISTTTNYPTHPETGSSPSRELVPSEVTDCENSSDSHRSITELVATGSGALTHFGARRRHLLRSESSPSLHSSPHFIPSPFRHFPVGEEPAATFAVHRPGPGCTVAQQTSQTENLAPPQHIDEFSTAGQSSQHRSDLVRRERISDLPTAQELQEPPEHSPPPPSLPPRSDRRPNPYHPRIQAAPTAPLVRRRAVSYRNSRPLFLSGRRQGNQRTRIEAAPTHQRIPPNPGQQQPFSFCKEDFSSSPLSSPTSSAAEPQSRAAPEIRTSLVVGKDSSGRASSSPNIYQTASWTQGQVGSETDLSDFQGSEKFGDSTRDELLLGIPRRAASLEKDQSSSSPLAAFYFGFDNQDEERRSESDLPDSVAPPNTPAGTHPNLTNFEFSYPTVGSTQEEASEKSDSEEPSLPSRPLGETGQAPRGLASAVAQIRRKFEPESDSPSAGYNRAKPRTRAAEDIVPRLELPTFSHLSLGLDKFDSSRPGLSEVAKRKKSELQTYTQNPGQASEDMDLLHPESAMAMTKHRREAVRMAKSQEAAVVEKCKRSGAAAPGYTFDELIGKGSFGRVYKGRQTSSQKVVAIKVIDVDSADFRAFGDQKDEQINDFNKEIRILRQAQESGAPNLNQMIEALSVHSQLWLVCEYCPGGSVKTLMRATNDKLGERYIIVVARELSKALKGLHDAGIMHRDIKAANVLIHEEGRLQLCDFGVATVLDKKTDKRRTFIGTLHWMPPELWDRDPEYSDEVDVWAFGCTLYECAVGKPPNSDLREPHQLRSRMRRLNQSIELPENGNHSSGLRSLVSYTLTPDAATRPSFSDVLMHDCLANTEESHPTTILSELVKVYYSWLYGGGQRASLFMPGGAAAGDTPGSLSTSDEDWNFSATDNFENRMSTVLNIPDFSDLTHYQSLEGDSTPKPQTAAATGDLSAEEKANFEERVRRGADLSNIFDQNKPSYEYVAKSDFIPIQQRRASDLPLRAMAEERPYSIANQVIDLGDFDSSNYAAVTQAKDEKIKLADAATIKANRGNSKLFSDATSAETLTTKPPTSTNERSIPTINEGPHPATQDFSFAPKEWNPEDEAAEKGETAETSQPRDPAKHKTMEWSFASAMSEAEEETKPKKHDTMQWSFQSAMAEASTADTSTSTTQLQPQPPPQQQPSRRAPPPLLRSITEPMGGELSRPSTSHSESSTGAIPDEADPFALDNNNNTEYPPAVLSALDERGISSFYGRERDGVMRAEGEPEGGLPVGEGEGEEEEGEGEGENEGNEVVTMPAIHGVDARVLDGEAPSSALEVELDRLLTDFQGVLGGAGMAVGLVGRRGKRGRGREREGEGEGEREDEWEDEEEE